MGSSSKALVLVALLGATGFLLWRYFPLPTYGGAALYWSDTVQVTYKLSLDILVEGKPVQGRGVLRSRYSVIYPRYSESYGQVSGFSAAEAIPIELPDGRVLVILLTTNDEQRPNLGHVLLASCQFGDPDTKEPKDWLRKLNEFRGSCDLADTPVPSALVLPSRYHPSPAQFANLEAGTEGIRLVGGRVEYTNAEPTNGRLRSLLPWLWDMWQEVAAGYPLDNLDALPRWKRKYGFTWLSFIWGNS